MAKKLTPQQRLFIQEYLVDKNATQAAIRAGYSEVSAKSTASDLLTYPNVAREVEEGIKKQLEKAEKRAAQFQLTKERWIKEIALIAFSNYDDFVEVGFNGVKIKETAERKKNRGRVIKKISESTSQYGGSISLELHSKLEALTLIGKHFGWLTEKLILKPGTPETENERPLKDLTDEELDKL